MLKILRCSRPLRVDTLRLARGGGLQPPITGPEPGVLPITPPPNGTVDVSPRYPPVPSRDGPGPRAAARGSARDRAGGSTRTAADPLVAPRSRCTAAASPCGA